MHLFNKHNHQLNINVKAIRKGLLLLFFTVFLAGSVMAKGMFEVRADSSQTKQTRSDDRPNVAFVVSDGLVLMDLAGPLAVFGRAGMKVYTVAASTEPIRASRVITITPNYTFENAPMPDIVVVGAQSGGPKLAEWLKKIHAQGSTIMSVCTGAFNLAQTGLLAGKKATTHHGSFVPFSLAFPDIKLVKEVRYVKASPTLFTSAGVTSGIDLALHIVAERFGQKVAQRITNSLEYQGTGWKTNEGMHVPKTPIKHWIYTGKLPSGARVTVDIRFGGNKSAIATVDIPAWNVTDAPTPQKLLNRQIRYIFPVGEKQPPLPAGRNAIKTAATTG